MTPLKPCPFCGGEVEVVLLSPGTNYQVACTGDRTGACSAHAYALARTPTEVRERWNRRADGADGSDAVRAALEFAVERLAIHSHVDAANATEEDRGGPYAGAGLAWWQLSDGLRQHHRDQVLGAYGQIKRALMHRRADGAA